MTHKFERGYCLGVLLTSEIYAEQDIFLTRGKQMSLIKTKEGLKKLKI